MLAENITGQVSAWQSICLAEYRSDWTAGDANGAAKDMRFHFKFGPPHIQPVCCHEVLMYFDLDEVIFYEDDNCSVE